MSSLLFGVIVGPDVHSIDALLARHRSSIDGIELRLDYFTNIDREALKTFMQRRDLPVMFTLRRNDQGGSFLGSEQARLDLLESLCTLDPDFVDLEYDVPLEYRKRLYASYPRISFLSSYHDFSGTPEDLEEVYQKVKTPYAHIYKIAVTAKSSLDALKVLSFVRWHSDKEKIIGIAMGEEGKPTRILAPVVGSFLTYATCNSESMTAPGQLSAHELQEIYGFRKLNSQTQIYCLIGDPVNKSVGDIIHNAVFIAHDLNAVYIKLLIRNDELAAFFTLARFLNFSGMSVTMPHKMAVMPYLTQMSIQTRMIGACNTIKISGDDWVGYTTDGIGALNAIERRTTVFGKHLVFVGAGGAAKAIILEAAQRGAFVTVINRTPEKAVEIAKLVGGNGGGWELFTKVCESGYDVIINCIPDSDLVDEKWILPGKIAMDIVYVPKNTPFLAKASRKKCQIVFGYEMFVCQAIEQERIWFPDSIDFNKAFEIIEEQVLGALTE